MHLTRLSTLQPSLYPHRPPFSRTHLLSLFLVLLGYVKEEVVAESGINVRHEAWMPGEKGHE